MKHAPSSIILMGEIIYLFNNLIESMLFASQKIMVNTTQKSLTKQNIKQTLRLSYQKKTLVLFIISFYI